MSFCLSICIFLLVFLPVCNAQSGTVDCGQTTFSSPNNYIISPNYPNYYDRNQVCNYFIVAPSLSTITFTFSLLSMVQSSTCIYDWIEFTCTSNSISRPIRYCGSGDRPKLTFKPCTSVSMKFSSDNYDRPNRRGYFVFYKIEPIRCQGNCAPVAVGSGYNCTCDANQTPYIAPPYNQCPNGCDDSSTYCSCITTGSDCGQTTFNSPNGTITSPNYPNYYDNNQACNYFIVASSLSTITFTFNDVSLVQSSTCLFDWIEFTCTSNSVSRPIRYCGSLYRPDLTFKPCTSVSLKFYSDDDDLQRRGFFVSYQIETIRCQGNCDPVAVGSGYNCTCDANQTPYIAPPYNQCPNGCYDSSSYCACSVPIDTSINTTTTPSPSTKELDTDCGQTTFTSRTGIISSPNYPNYYEKHQTCTYLINAPSLSTINFTFNELSIVWHPICRYDSIVFTCTSNSYLESITYCGYGYRPELSFKPCTSVSLTLYSDVDEIQRRGFFVSYFVEPIRCQGNCDPVAVGSGYNCTCDANQTPYTAPPYSRCPDSSCSACLCNSPPTTTAARTSCFYPCYIGYDNFGNHVCLCPNTSTSTTSTSTTAASHSVCSPNCVTYGCTVNGAQKCDRCDPGFALLPTNTCTPKTSVSSAVSLRSRLGLSGVGGGIGGILLILFGILVMKTVG